MCVCVMCVCVMCVCVMCVCVCVCYVCVCLGVRAYVCVKRVAMSRDKGDH